MVKIAGLKYVGTDYVADGNNSDVVTKFDVDSEFSTANVSQQGVQGQINSAVSTYASQVYVNNALSIYAQSNYLTNLETNLVPTSRIAIPGGLVPLDNTGKIPTEFIPSLGAGYVLGPFGPTATFGGTTGATPLKIADWGIGVQSVPFQPLVFASMLVSAASGGRPVVEIRMSSGVATYSNQTLIARAVGRSNWNDGQGLTILPAPSAAGHTGASGSVFPATYNIWISAWLFDANSQSVTFSTTNIASAGVYLIRPQQ